MRARTRPLTLPRAPKARRQRQGTCWASQPCRAGSQDRRAGSQDRRADCQDRRADCQDRWACRACCPCCECPTVRPNRCRIRPPATHSTRATRDKEIKSLYWLRFSRMPHHCCTGQRSDAWAQKCAPRGPTARPWNRAASPLRQSSHRVRPTCNVCRNVRTTSDSLSASLNQCVRARGGFRSDQCRVRAG